MTGKGWSLAGGVLALTVVLGLGWVAARAQETKGPDAMQAIRADVARARPVSLSVAGREVAGSLTQEFLTAQLNGVLEEFVRQGLDFSLGDFRPVPIVVLYEDPTGKDRARMGVGISVPAKVAPKAPLKLMSFKFEKAVRTLHLGPHAELARVHRTVEEGLKGAKNQSASWPVVLQILDDPNKFKGEALRTVLNVPVK